MVRVVRNTAEEGKSKYLGCNCLEAVWSGRTEGRMQNGNGNDLISEVTVGTKALKWNEASKTGRGRAGRSVQMGLVPHWNRKMLQPQLLKEMFRSAMGRPDPAVSLGWLQ